MSDTAQNNTHILKEELHDDVRENSAQLNEEIISELTELDLLQQKIEVLELEKQQNWERYLASEAEMQNLRRRTERELVNAHKFALEKFLNDLIPVVDSLELGNQALEAEKLDHEALVKFKEGSDLTYKMFSNLLDKFAVKPIYPMGEKLNPDFHQALTAQPSEDHEPNIIIQVVQKGYSLNDRLLRPALVIVSK